MGARFVAWLPFIGVAFIGLALLGCDRSSREGATRQQPEKTAPRPETSAPEPPRRAIAPAAAIAHGGVGSLPEKSDGCRKAVDAALAAIDSGADPIDAVVAGVVILEDDPRFNAGTGSRVRLDGRTVQMDAAVMDSSGSFGAVAVIERVRNPVAVARAVRHTPHLIVAGEGATALARSLGFADYDPATDEMKQATAAIRARLKEGDPSLPDGWQTLDAWKSHWNFEAALELADPEAHDTVGVAVRTSDGRFAVALSTGGTPITLRGRVGDVPILGAGLFAGEHGAVAATGSGERIIERTLARQVHEWLAAGITPDAAADRALDALSGRGAIGLIVIGERQLAAAADRPMAWAARRSGDAQWYGP